MEQQLLNVVLTQPDIYERIVLSILTTGENIKEVNESLKHLNLIILRLNILSSEMMSWNKIRLLNKEYLNTIISHNLGSKVHISRVYSSTNINDADVNLINYLKKSNDYTNTQFYKDCDTILTSNGGTYISNLCFMKIKDKDDVKKVLLKFLSEVSYNFEIKLTIKIYKELNMLGDFINYELFRFEKESGKSDPVLYHEIILPCLGMFHLSHGYKISKIDQELKEVTVENSFKTFTYKQSVDRSGYNIIKLREDNSIYNFLPSERFGSEMTILVIKKKTSHLLSFNFGTKIMKNKKTKSEFREIKISKYLINTNKPEINIESCETELVGKYIGEIYGRDIYKYDINKWKVMRLKDHETGKKTTFSQVANIN